jgi:hypothetical protein
MPTPASPRAPRAAAPALLPALLLALLAAPPCAARVGGHRHNGDLARTAPVGLPTWPATYDAQQSTIFMPCNYSGYFNATFAGQFGVADFDWSNGKSSWANAAPMTCEEELVEQAVQVRAVNPSARVFVYRNLVKALPWFSAVREKIMDPAYSGWFLRFSGSGNYHVQQCDNNFAPPRCSAFYHDQDQVRARPRRGRPRVSLALACLAARASPSRARSLSRARPAPPRPADARAPSW